MSKPSVNTDREPTPEDFDGHLERPFKDLTAEEKLQWLWDMMVLRYYAKKQPAPPPDEHS